MLFVSVGLLEFPTACWAQRFLADSKAATSSGYWSAGARKQPASKQILLWDSPEEVPKALQTDWFVMTLTLHVRMGGGLPFLYIVRCTMVNSRPAQFHNTCVALNMDQRCHK